MIKKLVLIVVAERQLKQNIMVPQQQPQDNVQELHRKVQDVETELKIQVDAVITTIRLIIMNKNLLFAIDMKTKEVIVSEFSKRSNRIYFIERIEQSENVIFFNAVMTLESIANASNFNELIFKSMDKVCHLIYYDHKEIN